jgi:hypothetical protein
MAKKIVKYRLLDNGSIPAQIEDGGYFPNGDVLIGVTKENSDYIGEGVISTKAKLKKYLDLFGPFTDLDKEGTPWGIPKKFIELDTNQLATMIWSKKIG